MIDINDLSLAAEFETAVDEITDSGADSQFFAPPAPPDDGAHVCTLALGQSGIQVKRQRQESDGTGEPTGPIYLSVHLQMRPSDLAEGESGFVLFDRVTSIKLPNAGTSRIRAILAAARVPAPARCTLPELKAHIEAALASKPTVKVWHQWRGSVKLSSGRYFDVFKGQDKFPKDSSGKSMATVWVKVDESGDQPRVTIASADDPEAIEVRAQATPTRYGEA